MTVRPAPLHLLWLLALLHGCGAQVSMHNPRIPDPLIAEIPLNVAVRYPEKFDSFIHEERVIGKQEWQIDLGKSNRLLFDKLFRSMFSNVTEIGPDVDPGAAGYDALIEPDIDAFEFSVPEQSQTDAFAVWIRYRIRIFDDAGAQIANWPISAYGKSQTTTFGGDDALRRAAVLAMRDAAALIILQMDKATGISKLRRAAASEEPAVDADPPAAAPTTLQSQAQEDPTDDTG